MSPTFLTTPKQLLFNLSPKIDEISHCWHSTAWSLLFSQCFPIILPIQAIELAERKSLIGRHTVTFVFDRPIFAQARGPPITPKVLYVGFPV